MRKPVKKRALTLLEVVIALALAAILFSALFGRIKHLFSLQKEFENTRIELLSQKHLHERLSLIFHSLDVQNEGKKEPPFSSDDGKQLKLRFDNGLEKNLEFSGIVEGTISLKKEAIILDLEGKDETHRTEYLFNNVIDFQFHFFDLTKQKDHWVTKWKDRPWEFPPMIKLEITLKPKKDPKGGKENELLEFAFFLNDHRNSVSYPPAHSKVETKTTP